MTDLFEIVAIAVGAFAATNIDDFVLLTILFIDSQTGGLRRGYIVAGQYLGFAVLLATSGAVAAGLVVVPTGWLGLLGLLPLSVSVRGFLNIARQRVDDRGKPVASNSLLSVAAVTVANGGDNLAVYVLMFHKQPPVENVITMAVFALSLAVWCVGAALMSTRTQVVSVMIRAQQWLVPAVYLVIGTVILVSSGVLVRLAGTP